MWQANTWSHMLRGDTLIYIDIKLIYNSEGCICVSFSKMNIRFACLCLCSVPACDTVKWPATAKPSGFLLCMYVKENRDQHTVRWPVCIFIGCFLLCSFVLFLNWLLSLIPLGIFVHIFRIVITVHDMKILQSADDTEGIIGSPTPYKREGMAPLCACFKLEKIISHLWQSLVFFVYFAGKMSSAQEGPSSTTSVPDSPPGDSKPGPSQRPNSEFQLKKFIAGKSQWSSTVFCLCFTNLTPNRSKSLPLLFLQRLYRANKVNTFIKVYSLFYLV